MHQLAIRPVHQKSQPLRLQIHHDSDLNVQEHNRNREFQYEEDDKSTHLFTTSELNDLVGNLYYTKSLSNFRLPTKLKKSTGSQNQSIFIEIEERNSDPIIQTISRYAVTLSDL